jgi:hypothetical protein
MATMQWQRELYAEFFSIFIGTRAIFQKDQ